MRFGCGGSGLLVDGGKTGGKDGEVEDVPQLRLFFTPAGYLSLVVLPAQSSRGSGLNGPEAPAGMLYCFCP